MSVFLWFCIFASYLKGHFHAFVWLNKPFISKTLFENHPSACTPFFVLLHKCSQKRNWRFLSCLAVLVMAVKISEKSCKVSFLKAGDFWQDCSSREQEEGILSSVAVPTQKSGVVCRNPMSILRRQWAMRGISPVCPL